MDTNSRDTIGVIDPSLIRGTGGALALFKQQALFFERLTSPWANQIIKKVNSALILKRLTNYSGFLNKAFFVIRK